MAKEYFILKIFPRAIIVNLFTEDIMFNSGALKILI